MPTVRSHAHVSRSVASWRTMARRMGSPSACSNWASGSLRRVIPDMISTVVNIDNCRCMA